MSVVVHHLNCGCMCPPIAKILPGMLPKTFCCHCLLVETKERLILVDAGISTLDCDDPSRIGLTHRLFRFQLDKLNTAKGQVESLGFSVDDVSDIILTHLDGDHASGICDFPHANIHVTPKELEVARAQKTAEHRIRYRTHYLGDDVNYVPMEPWSSESWESFDRVQGTALSDAVRIVDLPGHTPGHVGVAVQTDAGWLLHAGDAYFHHSKLDSGRNAYRMLDVFERQAHMAVPEAAESFARVRAAREEMKVVCSHDATFFPELKV